jgi:hypothetical protein
VGVGPDDSWEDRDSTRTEDVGLPEHERDETRRQEGTTVDDDPAEVANMSDAGLSEPGLPAHEDDARRGPGHRDRGAEPLTGAPVRGRRGRPSAGRWPAR